MYLEEFVNGTYWYFYIEVIIKNNSYNITLE